MTGAARSPRQTAHYLSWHLSAVCRPRAALVVLLAPLLLSACQQDGGRHRLLSEVPGSHTHLASATLAQVCDDIWQCDDGVVNKPDYWLSLMECAPRMTPDDDGPAASDGGSGKPPSEERQTPKAGGTSAPGGGANATPTGAVLGGSGNKPPRSERQTSKGDGTSAPDGGAAAPPAAAARPPVAAPEAGEPRQ